MVRTIQKITIFIVLVVVLVSTIGNTVTARDAIELYELNNAIPLDPDETDTPQTCKTSGSTISGPLVGANNMEKIYNFFIAKGASKKAAAAITGSIWQESKGDPLLIQGGKRTANPATVGLYKDGSMFENKEGQSSVGKAWGLIQWDPGNAALFWQKQAGVPGNIATIEVQLAITWWHLNNRAPTSRKNVLANIEGATSIAQAVAIMSKEFFGCGRCMNSNRVNAAMKAFNEYPVYGTGSTPATPDTAQEGAASISTTDTTTDPAAEAEGGDTIETTTQIANCDDFGYASGEVLGEPTEIGGFTYTVPLAGYVLNTHDKTCLPRGSTAKRCHHDNTPAFDFIVPPGTKVLAITDGEILSKKDYTVGAAASDGLCRSVQFQGTDGWVYWYGHTYIDARVGTTFKAGEVMGVIGSKNCGLGGAAHLHIDRGSPKGRHGGSDNHRDDGFIFLMQSLQQTRQYQTPPGGDTAL